ncbi:probable RNA-binding protein 19 [Planococcus citri]|uniref:probable RNA-binding protein 19 n=1 Tax=Planococcus citri TaxID=170843 RepID=UPI0031F79C2D
MCFVMSRIIVKNLHSSVTEKKLKGKFSEKGVVTDVQLKYTKDGKFRHFGFVGYQTREEAEAAVEYFDKSYFNSLRITVQFCSELGDTNKPKAWSKYAPDSTSFKKSQQADKKPDLKSKSVETDPVTKHLNEKIEKLKDDPEFLEFLQVHKKDRKVWENDDITAFLSFKAKSSDEKSEAELSDEDESSEREEKKLAEDQTISDAEYLQLKAGKKTLNEVEKKTESTRYFTLVVRGLPYKVRKKNIKEFFQPLKIDSIRIPPKVKGIAYIGFKNENSMKKALNRNKSFIEGKQIFIQCVHEKTETNNSSGAQKNEKWQKQEDGLKTEETIAESGRIFFRNLPYTATEEEIQALFEKYGPITETLVPIDKVTRKIKGYGIVTFLIPEHAIKAFSELDGTIFHGRMLHLLPGKSKENNEIGPEEGSSFKTKKIKKLKEEAGSSHNWNTLFMGQNAVADIIANNYDLSKEEVFSGSNAAVRLALGETQLVNETKEFLEGSGVKLDAFNRVVNHRSKTVILAKNLPVGTTVNEIRELFNKHGVLGRTLLPPHGVTAIIEFIEPSEARTAFKRLAYSKFKNLPLYLEWAPDDTFVQDVPEKVPAINEEPSKGVEDEIDDPEDDATLFIKNLNFETTEDSIKEHFKNCGKIANVTVARKKDPKKSDALLSMGYGFIQFYRKNSTNVALKTLQQSMLDGHCIELSRSNRTLKADSHLARKENNVEKQTGTKILVRNIPFQAKQSELQELFKTFGDIKALRLPRKMVGTGPHRGFAFVEYHSKQDAKKAMQSLCQSTHLYGRRLVLEWAQSTEEDIDQIRKRTAERFHTEQEVRSKKSTADIINTEQSDDE